MDDLISRQAAIDFIDAGRFVNPNEPRWSDNEVVNFLKSRPSAQPEERTEERTKTHACDCINRQAAIDIERNATVDTNPSHFEAHQKFTQFLDDAEISSFGRWQWSNGFNTALTAVGIDLKKLPSAQPEIVRCKECKHWDGVDTCDVINAPVWDDDFCSMAERRSDE